MIDWWSSQGESVLLAPHGAFLHGLFLSRPYIGPRHTYLWAPQTFWARPYLSAVQRLFENFMTSAIRSTCPNIAHEKENQVERGVIVSFTGQTRREGTWGCELKGHAAAATKELFWRGLLLVINQDTEMLNQAKTNQNPP